MKGVIIIFIFTISAIESQDLKNVLLDYFNQDETNTIKNQWDKYREALEHAIAVGLQETTGKTAMNIITLKPPQMQLSSGLHQTHGRVQVFYYNMELSEMPQLWMPDVAFSLSSNVLKIQSMLSTMIIHADYFVLRNTSDIVHSTNLQDPYKHTPYLFSSVQVMGKVAISVENCILSGYILTRMKDGFINLGHYDFTLDRCDYILEIYQPSQDTPPVIVRYASRKSDIGVSIEKLLLKALQDELIPKLQGIVFSNVNTSALLGASLTSVEILQNKVFDQTTTVLNSVIRNLNKKTADDNNDAVKIEGQSFVWNDIIPDTYKDNETSSMVLENLVLSGLDTAYATNTGGPYKLDSVMVGEQIRFSALQVRGDVTFNNKDSITCAIEINDLAVNIAVDIENNDVKMNTLGFREIAISQPIIYKPAEVVLTGYISNKLPEIIQENIKIDINDADAKKGLSITDSYTSDAGTRDKKEFDYFSSDDDEKARNIVSPKNNKRTFHRGLKLRGEKFGRKGRKRMSNNDIFKI